MKEYTSDTSKFSDEIKIFDTTDPGHADNLNLPIKQLLQNTLVLKEVLKKTELMGDDMEAPNKLDVMQEDIAALQTPKISEENTRENINEGDNQSTLWGKVKKWFSDLKSGAFASVANNCTTTEEGHVLDARQGRILQGQVDEINSNIADLGKSVADGKSAIASAITNKGVSTASDATFDVMAANIKNIKTISEAELSVKYYDSHTASSGGSQISNNKSCDLSSYKNVLGSAVGTVWSDNERSVTITDKKGHVKLFNLKNESGNIKFALNDLSGLNYNVSGTLNSSNGNFSFINLPPDCKVSCTAKSSSGSSTKTATVTLIVF